MAACSKLEFGDTGWQKYGFDAAARSLDGSPMCLSEI